MASPVKCYLCHKYGATEPHHVFEGRNRKNSDNYGAVIYICRACHNAIHAHPAEYEWLKQKFQKILMDEYGWSTEDFIQVFRRNYL